jgi:hypothetical protein
VTSLKQLTFAPEPKTCMYEHRKSPLISKKAFYLRVARNFIFSFGILFFSLGIGVAGYHFIGGLSWLDSFLNASMILTGMGPVNPMTTDAAKLFASFYALFSGLAFLSVAAVLFAPVFHRFLHRFHLDMEDDEKK